MAYSWIMIKNLVRLHLPRNAGKPSLNFAGAAGLNTRAFHRYAEFMIVCCGFLLPKSGIYPYSFERNCFAAVRFNPRLGGLQKSREILHEILAWRRIRRFLSWVDVFSEFPYSDFLSLILPPFGQ